MVFFFFFFNDTATTEIYTLSLHDALPICVDFVYYGGYHPEMGLLLRQASEQGLKVRMIDRKSTRLNSSHLGISYAVFCLKKKKPFSHGASRETQARAHLHLTFPRSLSTGR